MDAEPKLECTSNISPECKTNFLSVAALIEHVYNIHDQFLCSTCVEFVAQTEEAFIAHIDSCDSSTNSNRKEANNESNNPSLQDEVIEIGSEEVTLPLVNETRKLEKSPETITKKKEKKNNNKGKNESKDKNAIPSVRVTRSQSQLNNGNSNIDNQVTGRKRGRKPKQATTAGNEKKQTLFPCGISDCSSAFDDLKQLYTHRCNMHPENTFYVCTKCNYIPYFNLQALKKHESVYH